MDLVDEDDLLLCAASVTILACASAAVTVIKKRKRKRSVWMKRYLMSRETQGASAAMFRKVHATYPDDYHCCE